jgi:hypothetical protein
MFNAQLTTIFNGELIAFIDYILALTRLSPSQREED